MNSRFFTFLFLCFFKFSFSQDCIYTEFGINDGLPSLEIYDLYQDKNGNIWSASDRGLAAYNGYEFKEYGIKDGILNHVILDFYPQKDGNIYCSTFDNQLFYFNEEFNGFKPYAYNSILKQELRFQQHINSLYVDSEGSLHISCDVMFGKLIISKNGDIIEKPKLYSINEKKRYWMDLQVKGDDSFFQYYTNDSIKNDKNTLKFSVDGTMNNEAIFLKGSENTVLKNSKEIRLVNKYGNIVKTIKMDNAPISIKKIDDNHFFTGYFFGGGIIRDKDGNIVEHFLKDKSVSDFLIDNEGGYWFSTLHSGMFYVKEPSIKFVKTNVHSPIWTLTKNSENELYVGYSTGEVIKLDTNYNTTYEQEFANNSKAFVEFDAINKQLYVHSNEIFYKKKHQSDAKIYFKDSLTLSYAVKLSEPSTQGMVISQRSKFTILQNDASATHITTPFRTQDAAIWNDETYLGTPLGVYISKNDTIISLAETNSIFKNRVDDIDINEQRKELYFATLGAGIILYDIETKEVRNITKQDGLSSDIINELYIENKNELWVCTNAGLNKILFHENNTYEITGLKSVNGLLNDGIKDVEVINNTVWIASRKGLIHAPKYLFDQKNETNSYYLRIKNCFVNDMVATPEKLKNLSYTENRLEFLVEGVSFKKSNELLYKYKVEGLDTKWYYTKNRSISYPVLPYGNYTFKVAATISKNNENLTFLEIPIHITAPFWKQAWFIISVIFAIGLLIFLFFKYRILSYNRHIIRELLRLIVKKIKRKEKYFTFKEAGKEIRIKTDTILYVKSSGNYIELITETKNYTIRKKIGEFIDLMPDPLEYLRIHRSYIIRMEKVAEKNNKEVTINDEKLPVSNTYVEELNNLIF
ncbi:LytTR family transcriptional regulator DNA-binding domain-containing protein [uncultured Kordia sp.]|uniref:ligand-binding sensor domain-containing protein n=1 Tax=uncultured Kordia sp. TaxID=507699 RepID=UPI0026208CF3|nr:LytTR family transcriptional regulator DNA-binding domain-containing protein [uncultured Kordia sp.]